MVHFDSTSITGDALYAHVFFTPGNYPWSDANGSAVKDDVKVDPLPIQTTADNQRLLDAIKKAHVVEVSDKSVYPHKLEIVVGQIVFWPSKRLPASA